MGSLIQAAIRLPIFLWAWIRSKPVTLEVAQSRLAICWDCPELDLMTRQCRKCWCFIVLKVQWQAEKCPLKKW
jgi:hypothetical protein